MYWPEKNTTHTVGEEDEEGPAQPLTLFTVILPFFLSKSPFAVPSSLRRSSSPLLLGVLE